MLIKGYTKRLLEHVLITDYPDMYNTRVYPMPVYAGTLGKVPVV